MIVVAIVGILSAIAYPSYIDYVVKTRRATAAGCLMELSQFMERYYTTRMTYLAATLPATSCQTDLDSIYAFSHQVDPTATTFSIQAAPQGLQGTRDTKCATLRLDQSGAKTITGTGTVSACW